MAVTKAWGVSGDAGQTAPGTYTFTVPGGVTSIVVQVWAPGGGAGPTGVTGADAGVKDAGGTWLTRASGGGANGGTPGTAIVGTGHTGGNASGQEGGGGGAGPTGDGGNPSGVTGGAAGTGGYAGAGGLGGTKGGPVGQDGADCGGGGGDEVSAGNGGSGGGFATNTLTVAAGDVLTIVVPAGGTNTGGDGHEGGASRVQLDYTPDLNFNEAGTITSQVEVRGGAEDLAQGPPPWLWAPHASDNLTFNEAGQLDAAAGVSGADTWALTFDETGALIATAAITATDELQLTEAGAVDGTAELSGSDIQQKGYNEAGQLDVAALFGGQESLVITENGGLGAALTLGGTDGLGGVFNDSGSLAGAAGLSGADTLTVGEVDPYTLLRNVQPRSIPLRRSQDTLARVTESLWPDLEGATISLLVLTAAGAQLATLDVTVTAGDLSQSIVALFDDTLTDALWAAGSLAAQTAGFVEHAYKVRADLADDRKVTLVRGGVIIRP